MKDVVLRDETFRQISDFIYEKSGIFIPDSKKYLVENRLRRLLQKYNLKGYDEFLYLVKYSANGTEQTKLFDAITTKETYFFRELQQLDVFVDSLVPRIIEARGGVKGLRVWSAGCSTGEEPYTLVMMLRERRPDVYAEVVATDISSSAIESAGRGVYSSYSIRNVPEPYMKKYFKAKGQDYGLDRSVKSAVKFKSVNLIDKKKMSDVGMVDVIFCRNVFIYFGDKARRDAVSFLYDSLRPGGFLFVGSSESLHNVTRAFKPISINRVVVYQKM